MAFVLIDTSAWLFNFPPRVVPEIRERIVELVQRDQAAVTSPILFELLQGVRSGEEFRRLHQNLSRVKAKTADFLIAYKAMRHRLTLLHADHDFDRIAAAVPLKTESYVRLVRSRKN